MKNKQLVQLATQTLERAFAKTTAVPREAVATIAPRLLFYILILTQKLFKKMSKKQKLRFNKIKNYYFFTKKALKSGFCFFN